MENKTILDRVSSLGLIMITGGMEKNPREEIERIKRLNAIQSIYGVVASISNDYNVPRQKIIKVVSCDNDGKWDKFDRGIYVKIPVEEFEGLSTDITDVFIGDRITVTLKPEYTCHPGTTELECFCYDILIGSGYNDKNGKIIPYEEWEKQVEKEADEQKQEALMWANASLIVAIISWLACAPNFFSTILGIISIVLGVKSRKHSKTIRAIIGMVIGTMVSIAWLGNFF